ncbi:MAG: hypothetical protein CMF75_11590 [Maricaulis sp.]|nr:hypothetical protein [Maricaulis sp.]|tara:strand:+ start:290 stop:733 length:444 start_codon:yes stop_codon:yes gene_type:complete
MGGGLQKLRRVLIALVAIQVLYGLYWALHDVTARLGLWPDAEQAADFVRSLGLVQEILFFSHVALNGVTLALVLLRWRLALPVFILSFVLDRGEWILMSGNTLFSDMVAVDAWALFSFTLQGAIFALLLILSFDGPLGPRPVRPIRL